MEFFLDNILYVAISITVFSSVFFFLKKNKKKNHVTDNSNSLSSEHIQIKLRAYERLILFLDRIEPVRMLNRLQLHTVNPDTVGAILIKNIITEYEYNVSQQIYVSNRLWQIIDLVKNTIINNIVEASDSMTTDSSIDDFVREVLQVSKKNNLIIEKAHQVLKKEVRQLS